MTKYKQYLTGVFANELRLFAQWCEDHHTELLPENFNFKALSSMSNDAIMENKDLALAKRQLSTEQLAHYEQYCKDNHYSIRPQPGQVIAFHLDTSGSMNSIADKETDSERIYSENNFSAINNTIDNITKYKKAKSMRDEIVHIFNEEIISVLEFDKKTTLSNILTAFDKIYDNINALEKMTCIDFSQMRNVIDEQNKKFVDAFNNRSIDMFDIGILKVKQDNSITFNKNNTPDNVSNDDFLKETLMKITKLKNDISLMGNKELADLYLNNNTVNNTTSTKYPRTPDLVGISGSTDNSKLTEFMAEALRLRTKPEDTMQGENMTMYDGKIISKSSVSQKIQEAKEQPSENSHNKNKPQ